MDEDHTVLEIELKQEQINTWIERLHDLLDDRDHIHLEYGSGQLIVRHADRQD